MKERSDSPLDFSSAAAGAAGGGSAVTDNGGTANFSEWQQDGSNDEVRHRVPEAQF